MSRQLKGPQKAVSHGAGPFGATSRAARARTQFAASCHELVKATNQLPASFSLYRAVQRSVGSGNRIQIGRDHVTHDIDAIFGNISGAVLAG